MQSLPMVSLSSSFWVQVSCSTYALSVQRRLLQGCCACAVHATLHVVMVCAQTGVPEQQEMESLSYA